MGAAFSLRMRAEPGAPAVTIPNRAALRRELEATIDRLIAALNALDADPDLEPDADGEPSLGWSPTMALGTADDLEGTSPEASS